MREVGARGAEVLFANGSTALWRAREVMKHRTIEIAVVIPCNPASPILPAADKGRERSMRATGDGRRCNG